MRRVFSIYMTLTYMGIGIGQQLLNFGGEDGRNSFLIAALLFSLSLIPVSATRSVHPELPQPTRYNFKALFQKVPIGMLGCFSAGLVNSAFFRWLRFSERKSAYRSFSCRGLCRQPSSVVSLCNG
jgi:hypothetical protein